MDPVVTENNEIEQLRPHGPDDSCDLNPEFAVICSFIANFGDKIELELNLEQLKSSIENQNRLDNRLIDLHVKLLKKLRRYFVRDQWEKALIRFASEYSYEDAYEIEQSGYLKTRPSVKLQLLRRLLDAQFECDQKFKASVNLCEADDLRILPLGRDIRGNTYWQRADDEGNFRIFQEQPMDYKSWKTICSKPEELKYLIDDLEATKDDKIKGEPINEPYDPLPEIFPEYFKIEETPAAEVEEPSVTKKVGKGRRGKKGGKNKKLSLLAPVQEEEDSTSHNVPIKSEPSPIKLEPIDVKPTDVKPDLITNHINNAANVSIESQVRFTLENLINKVVASFDFLTRPLSRMSAEPVEEEEPQKPVKKQTRKKQPKREKVPEEVLPRRSSSRIQQLQLKKTAEEEEKMKVMIESSSNKKSNFEPEPDETSRRSTSSRANRSESPRENSKPGRRKRKGSKTWRRGKSKKKLSWDKDDSDLSSVSSVSASNDDDDEFDEELETLKFDNANEDDEFACEDEDTSIEPVIIKRARTARQNVVTDEQGDLNTSSIIEEDKPCGRCDRSDDPEWILLCDMCDDGYHTSCCLPPLMIVPDGDWFCPPCEHKTLLTKLKELYASIIDILETRERERVKRQKLRQNAVKKESTKPQVDEITLEKRPRDILNELNDPVALQDLDDELEESSSEEGSAYSNRRAKARGKRAPRKKKVAKKRPRYEDEEQEAFRVNYKKTRKTYSRQRFEESGESQSSETTPSESSEEDEPKPKTRRARATVSYRYQEYDELIQSAIQADPVSEGSEDAESEGKPRRAYQSRGKDMATIEALAYQQENGLTEQPPVQASAENSEDESKRKPRKKSRRLNDLDADTEADGATSDESFQASSATELEEDDDDEIVSDTEVDSDDTSLDEIVTHKKSKSRRKKGKKRRSSYESDDSDFTPRTTRRAATKQVSYRESSDEDDFESFQGSQPKQSKKKNILESSDDSEASWKSLPKSPIQQDDDNQSTASENSESKPRALDQDEDRGQTPPIESGSDLVLCEDTANTEPQLATTDDQSVKNRKGKKVRLEKQEPKAIVSLNQSIDEIAAPLVGGPHDSNTIVNMTPQKPNIARMTRDPIEELNQYCSESSHPTTMFNSYNQALSRETDKSPPHPPFFDDNDEAELKPTSSNGKKKSKKAIKPAANTAEKQSADSISSTKDTSAKNRQKTPQPSRTPPLPPTLQTQPDSIKPTSTVSTPTVMPPERAIMSQPRFEQSLPPRQTRPLVATPPRYHTSQGMQPQVFSPIQTPQMSPYNRVPYPNKYPPMHPQSAGQVPPPYSPAYANAMPMLVQQPRSAAIPIGAYANASHLQIPGMWGSVPGGSASRQPMPNMFYPQPGAPPMHNPNFSIHQLLGSPYPMANHLGTQPNLPNVCQPPSSIGSPALSSQPGQSLSQASSVDSSNDGRPATDKDMIRGMSDVISFIGDT